MAAVRVRADGYVAPCIPTLAAKPPSEPDWVHEIKHDGYRLIVRRDGPVVRLFTRRGYDWTVRFPGVARAASKLYARSFTLDGEAVVCGPDGVANFDALHRRGTVAEAVLHVFDLLELNSKDQRPFPLSERRAKLDRLLDGSYSGIAFNEHTEEDGAIVFGHACRMGLVPRFRGSNHIDITNQPRPEERARGARLEGRPQATWCRRRSFETPCFAQLLRMRSAGLDSNWSDLIGFMESIY